jgi:hypothetical protein
MASKKGRAVGRPKVIDLAKRNQIIGLTSALGSRQLAAAKAGIHYSTLARAFHADEDFAEALSNAVEVFKMTHLANIARASKKDWNASKWILERKFPEEYGRRNADAMTPAQVTSALTQLHAYCKARLGARAMAVVQAGILLTLEGVAGATSKAASGD